MQTDTTRNPNTLMAVVAYIVFFIPLLTNAKEDHFVKYHVKQGLGLVIFAFIGHFILASIPVIGWLMLPFFSLLVIFLFIKGILNALWGKETPLPLIGGLSSQFHF